MWHYGSIKIWMCLKQVHVFAYGIDYWGDMLVVIGQNQNPETIAKKTVCKHCTCVCAFDFYTALCFHRTDSSNRQPQWFHNKRKLKEIPDTHDKKFTLGHIGNWLVLNVANLGNAQVT